MFYTFYTSPNGAFSTVEELGFSFEFDDTEYTEGTLGFALNPSFTIAFEIDNTAFGSDEGVYYELAIAPSFGTVYEGGDVEVELSVPITVGLGTDYYEDATDDEFFGFFDIGVEVGTSLNGLVGNDYGDIALGAGVHVLFLGDTTSEANDGGDDVEVIGTVSLSSSF